TLSRASTAHPGRHTRNLPMRRILFALGVLGALAAPRPASAAPVTYTAPTGQTATADFTFPTASTLQIVLTETSPASLGITGRDAILTGIAFTLPVNISGGSVAISSGSTGLFDTGTYGAGTDVSHEYGVTLGTDRHSQDTFEPFGPTQQVSTIGYGGITQLAGTNLDGPDALDGPQGGTLDNSAAGGGLGVIDNSVTIPLNLASALTAAQQAAFLANLSNPTSGSFVIYGSHAAVGTPGGGPTPVVPEPGTLVLAGMGAFSLLG